MNNTQLYLSIGVPSFLVILAWVSNRADIQRMADRIDRHAETMRAEMIALRREINADFVAFRKEVNAEMTAFRREIHSDMVPLHERMAKIEERQEKP